VLSYTPGVGGTFNPTTPSTFTFTNFSNDSLSPSPSYTHGRIQFRWGGTTPYPGAFTITGLSASNPGTAPMNDASFLAGTLAGSNVASDFALLSQPFVLANLNQLSTTFTIPTLTAANGFFIEARFQLIDNIGDPGSGNSNFTQWQRATASTPVPEPASTTFLLGAAAAGYLRRRRRLKRETAESVATSVA
jgi:hypothetical protein